jgi:methionyl-tRNA synthetase
MLNCDKHLDNFEFNEAINAIWDLERFLDKYIEETKPWEINEKEELIKLFSKLVYAIRK